MKQARSGDDETGSSRTRGIRRKQGALHDRNHADSAGATGRASRQAGAQPQRANRTVRTRADWSTTRRTLIGGIVRQLITKADSQLAKVDEQLGQLDATRRKLEQEREEAKQERAQLQAILEGLQQTGQENSLLEQAGDEHAE